MAVIRVLGSRVIVRRPPPWARKSDFVLASGPFNTNQPGQLLAKAQLIDAASAAYGRRGFVGGLPVVAAAVQQATAGHTTVPGGANARRQQARQASHAAAPGRAAAFRARASGMPTTAGAGYEMF